MSASSLITCIWQVLNGDRNTARILPGWAQRIRNRLVQYAGKQDGDGCDPREGKNSWQNVLNVPGSDIGTEPGQNRILPASVMQGGAAGDPQPIWY